MSIKKSTKQFENQKAKILRNLLDYTVNYLSLRNCLLIMTVELGQSYFPNDRLPSDRVAMIAKNNPA